jgi:hypothetical protein
MLRYGTTTTKCANLGSFCLFPFSAIDPYIVCSRSILSLRCVEENSVADPDPIGSGTFFLSKSGYEKSFRNTDLDPDSKSNRITKILADPV